MSTETVNEVLAVMRVASPKLAGFADRIAAALLPSAADEPVLYQFRPMPEVKWMECSRAEFEARCLDHNSPDDRIEWRALYPRPASARPSAGVGELRGWWQAVEDDKSAQGEAFADHHTVIRYVGESVSATLTAGAIRAALSAPVAPAAEGDANAHGINAAVIRGDLRNTFDPAAEGWVLVPPNPTAEMMRAWESAPKHEDYDAEFCRAYAAMLAAAQPGAK